MASLTPSSMAVVICGVIARIDSRDLHSVNGVWDATAPQSLHVPTGPLSDASLMCSTVEQCAVGRARGEARMVSLVTAVLSIAPR